MTQQKNPIGRPTDYSEKLAENICNWIAGGNSLRSFCRSESAPDVSTVCRWIIRHDEFRKQYVQAREAAGYAHGDKVIEVVELLQDKDIDAQTAKAMMDGLKWAAERMAPRAHAPRSTIDSTSSDGTMTPKPTVVVTDDVNDILGKL